MIIAFPCVCFVPLMGSNTTHTKALAGVNNRGNTFYWQVMKIYPQSAQSFRSWLVFINHLRARVLICSQLRSFRLM